MHLCIQRIFCLRCDLLPPDEEDLEDGGSGTSSEVARLTATKSKLAYVSAFSADGSSFSDLHNLTPFHNHFLWALGSFCLCSIYRIP